jgi:hypothetical protein
MLISPPSAFPERESANEFDLCLNSQQTDNTLKSTYYMSCFLLTLNIALSPSLYS